MPANANANANSSSNSNSSGTGSTGGVFDQFKITPDLTPKDPRFGCGPSLIPMERLQKLAQTGPHLLGTSHRHQAIRDLVGEVISGLRTYFKIPKDFDVVLGNGGATFLFDMLALSLVEKKAAHFTCGEFSQKWYLAAKKVPWITAQEISVPAGQGITPHWVEEADFVATTLNETSTGVQIDTLPSYKGGRKAGVLLAVDATSGAGQIACDISQTDVFFFSPQKVFASEGGLWVAIMSPEAVERALRISKDKSRYIPEIMNFTYAIENSRKAQTYNTPAIVTLYLLNEQLKELNALGYDEVCAEATKKANFIYQWAEEKSYLSPYIEEKKYRSHSVATINVDERVNVDAITDFLSKKKLVYGIDPYRKLGKNQLRISLFHNITFEDIKTLTKLISSMLESVIK